MTSVQLYYFKSVAETLNFTKAAQENYVAQTAISQQIASLEKELGVSLFNRTTRQVSLTEAGRSFYSDVVNILNQLELAQSKAQHLSQGVLGFLRLGCAGRDGLEYIADLLHNFRTQFPHVELSLTMEMSDILLNALQRSEVDAVVIYSKTPAQLLEDEARSWVDLTEFPICFVISTHHELAQRESVTMEEIASLRLLSGPQRNFPRRTVNLIEKEFNNYYPIEHDRVYTDDELLCLVEAGYGCALLPQCISNRCHNKPRFVSISDFDLIPHMMLGWNKNCTNPVLPHFLQVFRNFYCAYNSQFDPARFDSLLPKKSLNIK